MGRPARSPGGDTIRLPPDLTQENHFDGLPIGTRGGVVVPYTFPLDAEYEISIRLARDRNEHHAIELLVDKERVRLFTVEPPARGDDHSTTDHHLKARVAVEAGPHEIAAAFIKKPAALLETARQPYEAHFNFYRHPRIQPAGYSISILGPYNAEGPGDTPSRDRIFVCRPQQAAEEEPCAQRIIETLMRRAYRRPVADADLARPIEFYRQARADSGFEAGIEMALRALLVSPEFLFRVEQNPAEVEPETVYRVSDLQLASRLSFFLWSSIPDDDLLDAAIRGDLSDPALLEKQVRRMLADKRSESLVTNFGSQWLYLRNLASIAPDMRRFPDFDDNLRQAFRRETELFFESILREGRSVLDLLDADYTFVNERLAKHYGIPNIYGSRFRRISLDADSKRGGILRHGSILTVTSYPTRTSPVIRGKWILDNLLGIPPPPPPGNVPALEDNKVAAGLPIRARLAAHRDNPACAGCHQLMDPAGFPLETYDAVGRWRTAESDEPIDTSGGLPDGSRFHGVEGLQRALLSRPEVFVGVLTEKLLTYGLWPGHRTLRRARRSQRSFAKRKARISAFLRFIMGIASSTPFQMRRSTVILTKTSLPRRTLLRGFGATLALPLLDAMVPAMTAQAATPARPLPRLGFVYMPMGSDITQWTPRSENDLSKLSPSLSSLAPVRNYVTAITNLELKNAYPGTHATSNAAFLSAAKAKWTESSDYFLGTTVDQIAAKHIGQETRLPSLELSMDLVSMVGQCDNGFACVYQNNLSWSSPTSPLPSEAHPRVVFERLFGEGGSVEDRRAALRERASLLDWVRDDISRLRRQLGPNDRTKVNDYLDTEREVERRVQKAEAETADNILPDLDRPVGVPAAYADHAKMMFDLQVLALQGDVTRVTTFQLARETSNRTYPEIGVPDPHHPLTHHGGDVEKIAKVARINAYHVSLFTYFLEKLKSTPEGDGTLLDHVLPALRQRDGEPERPRPCQFAYPRRRRRSRQNERRTSYPLRRAHSAR